MKYCILEIKTKFQKLNCNLTPKEMKQNKKFQKTKSNLHK